MKYTHTFIKRNGKLANRIETNDSRMARIMMESEEILKNLTNLKDLIIQTDLAFHPQVVKALLLIRKFKN